MFRSWKEFHANMYLLLWMMALIEVFLWIYNHGHMSCPVAY